MITMEKIITVKEELAIPITIDSASSSSSSLSPRPMEGLHDMGPPPFLNKTYEMVEDPSSDPIVSWSKARNSFIVWDSHQFSLTLLPRYFKHNNFSSFIRRLNTYGFRKVDPDRWEFANEGFLGGQRQLLKTIKRRKHVPQSMHEGGGGACVELGQYGVETEIERLKRDRNVLMSEIVRLRQQQLNSKELVIAMEDRLQSTERKQQQIMNFLAKALKNPSFIQNFAQNRELLGGKIGRKRRLAASSSMENFPEVPTALVLASSGGQDGEFATMESDFESLFSAAALDNESSSDIKGSSLTSLPASSGGNLGTLSETNWEDFWGEELIGGNPDDEVVMGNDSEIDVEVEDLVADPSDWGEDLQDLVDQMNFLIKPNP